MKPSHSAHSQKWNPPLGKLRSHNKINVFALVFVSRKSPTVECWVVGLSMKQWYDVYVLQRQEEKQRTVPTGEVKGEQIIKAVTRAVDSINARLNSLSHFDGTESKVSKITITVYFIYWIIIYFYPYYLIIIQFLLSKLIDGWAHYQFFALGVYIDTRFCNLVFRHFRCPPPPQCMIGIFWHYFKKFYSLKEIVTD